MRTQPDRTASIRDRLGDAAACSSWFLWSATADVCLADLLSGTTLGGHLEELSERSVLVATRDQLAAALALIELDGIARRLVVCTPDLPAHHLPAIIAQAGVDAIVSDDAYIESWCGVPLRVLCRLPSHPGKHPSSERCATEWVLLTSGTTGAPKLVAHSLATLTSPLGPISSAETDVVWGTFYDIRRYGGLQILFRAVLGRGSFVLSGPDEPLADYLVRLGARGATHVSGTPSHWRRVLMSPAARAIAPRYVRLSGEIADQAILNALQTFYPEARIGHAFASTEAGVGFEVNDGLEGFPATLLGRHGDVEIRIEDGSLRIRSDRNSVRYLGDECASLSDDQRFIDTGDMVERRGDRYYFLGRRSGVINVGGLKVYPEEVEAAINQHPSVRMSMVRARKSPITGALVIADVVLQGEPDPARTRGEILQMCRETLGAHKIPATVRFVPELDVAAAGKLARRA
jgi:acyl-coenzyme A synthetase/AMP-(fatty) acid ligase